MSHTVFPPFGSDAARRLALVNLFLILAAVLLHLGYVLYGPLDLSGDEALYWQYGRHLDWSYYHKGPMVGWMLALSTALLGNTVLGVRLPAILLGAGFLVVSADLAKRVLCDLQSDSDALGRQRARLWTILLIVSQPMLAAGGVLMTIDTPFMFFWVIALWGLYRAMIQNWTPGWYVAGVAGGLGFLSKYILVLLAGGVVLFILLDAWRNRSRLRVLVNPHFWASAGLATLLTLPVWIWNAQHDWVGFRHVAGQASDGAPFSLLRPLETLASQMLNPFTFVLMVLAWWATLKWFFTGPDRKGGSLAPARNGAEQSAENQVRTPPDLWQPATLFLTCCSLPVLLFFLLAAVQTKVQPNWPVAVFAGGIVLVAAWLAQASRLAVRGESDTASFHGTDDAKNPGFSSIPSRSTQARRPCHDFRHGLPGNDSDATHSTPQAWGRLRLQLAKLAVWVGLPLVILGHDTRLLYLLGLDPKNDPAGRLMGWQELGEAVGKVRMEYPDLPVVSEHYQTASLMSFYVPGQPHVDLMNFGRRMDQYDVWNHGRLGIPEGGSAIFVGEWKTVNMAAPYKLGHFFDQIECIQRKRIYRAGQPLTEMPWVIVVAHGFRSKDYQAAVEKLNERF